MTSMSKFAPTEEELDFAKASMPVITPTITQKQSKYAPSEDEMAFAAASMAEPISDEIPWYKSYPAALAKGLTKGVISLGEAFGGLPQHRGKREEQEEQRAEFLEKVLPSEKGTPEEYLERAGKIAPSALSGTGGVAQALVRTGVAAAGGQAAKEFGAGETVQSLAELPAFLSPRLGKKIIPTKKQEPIIKAARELGLKEESIAPLIQSEKKQKILSKVASRSEKTQTHLGNVREEMNKLYEHLEAQPFAKNSLSKSDQNILMHGFKDKFSKLPDELRKKIAPDFKDLITGPIDGEKLINFWKDLNYHIKKGESQLGILKDPIAKSMNKIAPEFGKDFQNINELYSRYAGIRNGLKPNTVSKFFEKANPYKILGAIVTGYQPLLIEAVGEAAARKLSTELLLNPRFQNLSKQMVNALNENKVVHAQKVFEHMKNLIEKISPETYQEIEDIDFPNLGQQESNK